MCEVKDYSSLAEVIEGSEKELKEGQNVQVLFEDGIATVCMEKRGDGKEVICTYIEPIMKRVFGSIHQFKLES